MQAKVWVWFGLLQRSACRLLKIKQIQNCREITDEIGCLLVKSLNYKAKDLQETTSGVSQFSEEAWVYTPLYFL
jgi:hypothetical protein